jgi:cobalamin biosynthesis protein CobT
MSWVSDKHKDLYSKAFSAFRTDISNGISNISEGGKKLLSAGYEKAKEGYNYISAELIDIHNQNSQNGQNTDNDSNDNDSNDNNNDDNNNNNSDGSDSVISESSDNICTIEDSSRSYEDNQITDVRTDKIIIQLSRTDSRVKKIWRININDELEPIKGRMTSYKSVNGIIQEWFNYETKNNKDWRWYPKIELYTSWRQLSKKLSPMEFIVFKKLDGRYYPHPYHPLI